MAGSIGRRAGATFGLLLILTSGVAVIGGALAGVLALTVDDTPASEQAVAEAADVTVLRCGQNLHRMTARVKVTNHSALTSDYFIDVRFVRGQSTEAVEVVPIAIAGLDPDGSQNEYVVSTRSPEGPFHCRIGDVDRLST